MVRSSIVVEAKVEALKSIAKGFYGIDLVEVKVTKEGKLGRELSKYKKHQLFETSSTRLGRENTTLRG